MSRRAARFTQADIARAWKVVSASEVQGAVEVLVDGTIRIVKAEPAKIIAMPTPERVEPKRRIIF